ncbi:hypothetical protein OEZ85_000968 [Tetradesmus obliquus]|uniref:Uncharacterized protein n=1 Tax=Tetradesmus obliquus TaxID=3088 RepID=A0ABY8UML3_TETOB|nr:hypothetical protein OEZ85_000968 [Tetradesmus obliquus]
MRVTAALLNAGAVPVGITPLLAAAGHGQAGCLQLLQRHAGPGAWQALLAAKDTYGRSALHFAAASGHALVVEMLLACPSGLDVWGVSAAGRNALQEAQQSGHTACARLILPAMQQATAAAEAAAAQLLQQQQHKAGSAGMRSPGSAKGRSSSSSSSSRPHALSIPAAAGALTSPKQQRKPAPPHVLGCGLDQLSMSQLDALELVHRASLLRLGEARIALACAQHEQEAAEQAALKAEIAARAAARQQQQQQQ